MAQAGKYSHFLSFNLVGGLTNIPYIHFTALCCAALQCTDLHCIVLHCTDAICCPGPPNCPGSSKLYDFIYNCVQYSWDRLVVNVAFNQYLEPELCEINH